MATYGISPKEFFPHVQIDQSSKRDWSIEVLLALAKAYFCYETLRTKYPDSTNLDNQELIGKAIERAWRETLFVRSTLPESAFADVERDFALSRLGVMISDERENTYIQRGDSNRANPERKGGQTLAKKRSGARQLRRKVSR